MEGSASPPRVWRVLQGDGSDGILVRSEQGLSSTVLGRLSFGALVLAEAEARRL